MKKTPPLPPGVRHHRQIGAEPRVRIANGPTVDINTAATFEAWHKAGPSYGVIIDRLTSHALASGFSPVTCQVSPVPTRK